jgi:uncharacterized lipoprotein YmbA
MKSNPFPYALALAAALLAGCASNQPQTTAGLNTAQMEQSQYIPHTLVYRAPDVDVKKYTQFILDPGQVYRGSDARFKGVSDSDREMLAQFLHDEFEKALSAKSMLASGPGPNVVRLKLTLADVETTQAALATITGLTPIGMALNLGKSAGGSRGSFMGAATVACEAFDSQSGAFVGSFLTKQSPVAADFSAKFGALDAAKGGIKEIAERFVKRFEEIQKGK